MQKGRGKIPALSFGCAGHCFPLPFCIWIHFTKGAQKKYRNLAEQRNQVLLMWREINPDLSEPALDDPSIFLYYDEKALRFAGRRKWADL